MFLPFAETLIILWTFAGMQGRFFVWGGYFVFSLGCQWFTKNYHLMILIADRYSICLSQAISWALSKTEAELISILNSSKFLISYP